MAVSKLNPVSGGKTRRVLTLTSGTSWTVPTGVTFVNVTLRGGGGGGGGSNGSSNTATIGMGGDVVSSTLSTTPGASIAYAIGAGGTGANGVAGNTGGTTTFTGATSAVGGAGGFPTSGSTYNPPQQKLNPSPNGGFPGRYGSGDAAGGQGGAGSIDIEYWV
jgi:hypothetical protein